MASRTWLIICLSILIGKPPHNLEEFLNPIGHDDKSVRWAHNAAVHLRRAKGIRATTKASAERHAIEASG